MANDLFTFTLTRSQLQAAVSAGLLNVTDLLEQSDRICGSSGLSDEELVKLYVLISEASEELLGLKVNLKYIVEKLERSE